MFTHEEILEANRLGEELRRTTPHAVNARYDRRIGRVVVRLSSNLEISFAPRDAQGLETATWEQFPGNHRVTPENGKAGQASGTSRPRLLPGPRDC